MNQNSKDKSIRAGYENADPTRTLPGEDLGTQYVDDVEHWVSVYKELLDFKRRVLLSNKEKIAEMPVLQSELGAIDVPFLETEIGRLAGRLESWEARLVELQTEG